MDKNKTTSKTALYSTTSLINGSIISWINSQSIENSQILIFLSTPLSISLAYLLFMIYGLLQTIPSAEQIVYKMKCRWDTRKCRKIINSQKSTEQEKKFAEEELFAILKIKKDTNIQQHKNLSKLYTNSKTESAQNIGAKLLKEKPLENDPPT